MTEVKAKTMHEMRRYRMASMVKRSCPNFSRSRMCEYVRIYVRFSAFWPLISQALSMKHNEYSWVVHGVFLKQQYSNNEFFYLKKKSGMIIHKQALYRTCRKRRTKHSIAYIKKMFLKKFKKGKNLMKNARM